MVALLYMCLCLADIPEPPTRPPPPKHVSVKFTAKTESQVKYVNYGKVDRAKPVRRQQTMPQLPFNAGTESAAAFTWSREGFLAAKQPMSNARGSHQFLPNYGAEFVTTYAAANHDVDELNQSGKLRDMKPTPNGRMAGAESTEADGWAP